MKRSRPLALVASTAAISAALLVTVLSPAGAAVANGSRAAVQLAAVTCTGAAWNATTAYTGGTVVTYGGPDLGLGPVRPGQPRGALGRLALLRARLALAGHSKS